MKNLIAKIVFDIAGKWMVSTLAKSFVILFMICLVIGILLLMMFTFFFCETRSIKKHKKQNALLLVQNVDTRWNSTYLIIERLKKLKLRIWHYVANYKYDRNSLIQLKICNCITTFFYCSNRFL